MPRDAGRTWKGGQQASKSVLCQQSPEVPSAGKPFLPGRNSSWKFLGGHLLCWLLLLTDYTHLIKGCSKKRKQSIPIVRLDGDSGFRLLFYSHFGKNIAGCICVCHELHIQWGLRWERDCVPYTVSSVLGSMQMMGKCDPILREFVIQGRARYEKSGW